jgi:hypothetical protein
MMLSFEVISVVVLVTIAMGVVGYLVDRGTERHVDRGDRQ